MRLCSIIAIVLLAFIFTTNSMQVTMTTQSSSSLTGYDFLPVIERARIDYELVKEIVRNISSFGPRYTTYPGYEKTANYIKEWFKKYLEPFEGEWTHKYNLTVLVDYGGSLTLQNGEKLKAYPLMPNEVAPVYVKNLTGPIVYVRSGELHEMDGKPINGSIVVMDFNSNWRWLTAASLGAKAVIFLEPTRTSRTEALQKRLESIPFSFPRFYLRKEEAMKLLKAIRDAEARGEALIGTLEGRTDWEVREAENIMGFLKSPGKYSNDWVVITSYFDAHSVVPSLSTGASEAVSLAITLALAKYYSENPPEYSLLFVVFSGHHQGLWGAREWAEKYVFGPDHSPDSIYYRPRSVGENVSAGIQIDVIPDTPLVYPLPGLASGFYCVQRGGGLGSGSILPIHNTYKDVITQTGIDYGLITQGEDQGEVLSMALETQSMRPIYSPMYMRWLDLEILAKAGLPELPSLYFATGRSLSIHLSTPIDTYETIEPQMPNVRSQMELVYSWMHTILHDSFIHELFAGKPRWAVSCSRGDGTIKSSHTYLFHVNLEAVNWNYSVGWYTPVPKYSENQTILFVWYGAGGDWTYGENWYHYRRLCVMRADEEGKFHMVGVHSSRGYGAWRARVLDDERRVTHVDDFGQYALPQDIPLTDSEWGIARAKNLENEIKIPVFRCGGFIILDYVNPDYLDRTYLPLGISARYFEGHTPLVHHNIGVQGTGLEYHFLGYSVGAAFVEADKCVELLILTGFAANRPYIIFTNSTIENPVGSGYKLKAGEQMIFTIFDFARGLYHINEERVEAATRVLGEVEPLVKPHERVQYLLEEMERALRNYQYSEAYVKACEAWRFARQDYSNVRGTLEDAIFTVPFFSALIIPFAFLAERLLAESRGTKRLIIILGLCIALVLFFSYVHPGFTMASSSATVLISFAILALLVPAIVVIGGQTSSMLKEYRRKALGTEFGEVGRATLAVTSVSYGLGFMRRRKFRAGLTIISICLLVFAMVLFSSASGIQFTKLSEYPVKAELPYEGILLHKEYFGQLLENYYYGIGIRALDYLQAKFGEEAYIAPRLWVWPQHGSPPMFAQYSGFLITGPDYPEHAPYVVRALLGLTPQENELTNMEAALVAGRWFTEVDKYAIILPENVAKALGIAPEDLPVKVNLCGIDVTCIGIMGPVFDAITEMDGTPLTPIDFLVTATPPAHLFLYQIAIIPYKLWPDLDAYFQAGGRCALMIASVGIKFHNTSRTLDEALNLFEMFPAANMQIWASLQNRLYLLTVGRSVVTIGWREQLVPMALVGFTMLNLMFANVMDRRREIHIFSSVGLSPSHVALLFIAECIVYGVVGSLVGYIAAVTTARIVAALGLELGFLNYASQWVATVVALSIAVTVISGIYPTWLAAKLVTPSLERRWAIRTKPAGDEWDIPLPIMVSEEEAIGMLLYLREYLDRHMSSTAPEFSTERASTLRKTRIGSFNAYTLDTDARLIPYELGIRQSVTIMAVETESKRWTWRIHLTRRAGDIKEWVNRNRDFVDYLRKRLLVWRSLSDAEKAKYVEEIEKWKGEEIS